MKARPRRPRPLLVLALTMLGVGILSSLSLLTMSLGRLRSLENLGFWAVWAACAAWLERATATRRERRSWPMRRVFVFAAILVLVVGTIQAALIFATEYFLRGRRTLESLFSPSDLVLNLMIALMLITTAIALPRRRGAAEHDLAVARLERQMVRARLQFLVAQLKPHFLFNSLNAVLALLHDDPASAREMLRELTAFVEGVFAQEESLLTTVREELLMLEAYVAVQRRRFPASFAFGCDADPATLDTAIPTLLLQPFVENAIRHGLSGDGGSIQVRVRQSDRGVVLEVEDSGHSFVENARERIGLSNSRERLLAMYGGDHSLDIRSLSRSGTVVRIELPTKGYDAHAMR